MKPTITKVPPETAYPSKWLLCILCRGLLTLSVVAYACQGVFYFMGEAMQPQRVYGKGEYVQRNNADTCMSRQGNQQDAARRIQEDSAKFRQMTDLSARLAKIGVSNA